MNGRAWSREEIDLLVTTVTVSGNTLALAVRLRRSHIALMAKAKRLGLAC